MTLKALWKTWRSRLLALFHDLLMIPLAWLGAFWLRDNLEFIPKESVLVILQNLPFVMGIQTATFLAFHLYRGMWRYSSMADLMRIVKSVLLGTALTLFVLFVMNQLAGLPRSVLVLYPLLLLSFLSASRIIVRAVRDPKQTVGALQKPVLVIGAGPAAESLVRDLLRRQATNDFFPVGMIDDDPHRLGREIHGVRVLGAFTDIPKVVQTLGVERILIALPHADVDTLRCLVDICGQTGCLVSTLPSVHDIVDGRVTIEHLRLLSIEDLLGRDPIALEWPKIQAMLGGQDILVSGGGGSIGSELCRQMLQLKPRRLIVLDVNEYHLFQLEQEFSRNFPHANIYYHLVNVTDAVAVDYWMAYYRPTSVYHAAAYKHVPLLEMQPREAAYNNIFGTENMVRSAIRHQVARFVLVSTDKAVNPTNVMGTTKRIAEMICQSYQDQKPTTQLMMVRFGNVLGSRGSVLGTFKAQIERGGPVTVTHPEVTRYFMTIPEACQLILQCAVTGRGGEIFVLNMGEPIKIQKLAEQMIALAGKIPGQDIQIEYTGLRPGEKLFEELFHEREHLTPTAHPKLLIAQARSITWSLFMTQLQALKQACVTYQVDDMVHLLKDMVPEFETTLLHKEPVDVTED